MYAKISVMAQHRPTIRMNGLRKNQYKESEQITLFKTDSKQLAEENFFRKFYVLKNIEVLFY